MEQTTAKLRKAFRYPTDESGDSLPEALDEEEQENLIKTLQKQNTARNAQYRQILFLLPLVCTLPYITTILSPRTSLLSILSISSFLSTAYLTYILPPHMTSISVLDAINSSSRESPSHLARNIQNHGPIQTYLPYMNLGLSIVLALLGNVFRGKNEVWMGFGWLPAVIYGFVLLAKVVMGAVDPEAALGTLKYGFKGA